MFKIKQNLEYNYNTIYKQYILKINIIDDISYIYLC